MENGSATPGLWMTERPSSTEARTARNTRVGPLDERFTPENPLPSTTVVGPSAGHSPDR